MAAMILAMQTLVVTTSAIFEANADLSPYRAELAVAKGKSTSGLPVTREYRRVLPLSDFPIGPVLLPHLAPGVTFISDFSKRTV